MKFNTNTDTFLYIYTLQSPVWSSTTSGGTTCYPPYTRLFYVGSAREHLYIELCNIFLNCCLYSVNLPQKSMVHQLNAWPVAVGVTPNPLPVVLQRSGHSKKKHAGKILIKNTVEFLNNYGMV